MKSTSYAIAAAVALVFGAPAHSFAQSQVVVTYDHMNSDLRYQQAGDDEKTHRIGLSAKGDHLPVAEGGKFCIRIIHANPLLYTYASSSKELSSAQPSGLADLLAGLAPFSKAYLTASIGAAGADGSTHTIDGLNKYSADVNQLLLQQTNLAKLKIESDKIPRFDSTAAMAANFAATARNKDAEATKAYGAALEEAKGSESQKMIVENLHSLQQTTMTAIVASAEEFTAAAAHTDDLLCTDVKDKDLHVVLGITSKHPKGATPFRKAGDELVGVDIEPQSTTAFEVGTMGMLSLNLPRKTFAIQNGVIAEGRDSSVDRKVGVLALGRLWPVSWLWTAIGVSKGKDPSPDVFLGFVARSGWKLTGVHVGLGVGLMLANVPVGLGSDAKVGSALPAKVENLDKIIIRDYRPGVGVTLSLTGLQLSKP